jgi:hypothetical protein
VVAARNPLVARAANSGGMLAVCTPLIEATQDRVPPADGVSGIPFPKIVSKPLSKNVGKRYQAGAGVEADGAGEFVSPK